MIIKYFPPMQIQRFISKTMDITIRKLSISARTYHFNTFSWNLFINCYWKQVMAALKVVKNNMHEVIDILPVQIHFTCTIQ